MSQAHPSLVRPGSRPPGSVRPVGGTLLAVLDVLQSAEAPLRARDVARVVGVGTAVARRHLVRLWRGGLVVDVAEARDGQACLWVAV